jgi:hypothetical protein
MDLDDARRGPRLNPERDPEILAWMGRHGLVTTPQLARRFFRGNYPLAARCAKRLHTLKLIDRHHTFRHDPDALFLTRDGQGVADLDIAPPAFRYTNLRHTVLLVDLIDELATGHPDATVMTEREIRRDWRRRLRHPPGRYPDGMLVWGDGRTVGIELDLTAKRTRLYAELFRDYSTHSLVDFTAVWWYAPPALCPPIRRAVDEERFGDLIEVRAWTPPSFGA